MESQSIEAVTKVTSLAPQFLVDDLSAAIAYYRDRLGFETDFVYESFYASVSRDGFSIHLLPSESGGRTESLDLCNDRPGRYRICA